MSHVLGPRIGEHVTGLAAVSRRLGWGVRVVVSVGPGVSVRRSQWALGCPCTLGVTSRSPAAPSCPPWVRGHCPGENQPQASREGNGPIWGVCR